MRTPFKSPGAVILCVGALWLGVDTRGYAQSPFNNLDLVQIYINAQGQHAKDAERGTDRQ
jgi:hypothetical protein